MSRILLLVGFLLCLTGCGGGDESPPTQPVVAAPTISVQPEATAINDGAAASFNVTAQGPGPLSYQWQRNGVAIDGATTARFTTSLLAIGDSGAAYRVQVTGPGGSVLSDAATVTVKPLPPTIDAQPAAVAVTAGSSATFSVRANGTAPLTYRWFRGGVVVEGANAASITVDGLTYGDDATTYSVEVANSGGAVTSQLATLTIHAATVATAVSTCREITAPGHYRLVADLSLTAPGAACIAIRDTRDVLLDCNGHQIADDPSNGIALDVRKVQAFSIRNCRIQTFVMDTTESSGGSLAHNTFTRTTAIPSSIVNIRGSSRITFDSNAIASGAVQLWYGGAHTVSRNHIIAPPGAASVAGNIVVSFSARARVHGNVLDGRWNGVRPWTQDGADDGVILSDLTDAVVEDNTMADFFDCGVEFVGTITASTIRRNRISNTGVCGVGGWYWFSMVGSTIADNVFEKTPSAFQLYRIYGLRPAGTDFERRLPADTEVAFADNLIAGNVLRDAVPLVAGGSNPAAYIPLSNRLGYSGGLSTLAGERAPLTGEFRVRNNVFRNNDFGQLLDAPWFGPGPFVGDQTVDGGGNRCRPSLVAGFPLVCN
jgi:Right handed beta helix region/Immunoglobulin I-set domain